MSETDRTEPTHTTGRQQDNRTFWLDCQMCGGFGYELVHGHATPVVCVDCDGAGGWWVPVTEREEETQ